MWALKFSLTEFSVSASTPQRGEHGLIGIHLPCFAALGIPGYFLMLWYRRWKVVFTWMPRYYGLSLFVLPTRKIFRNFWVLLLVPPILPSFPSFFPFPPSFSSRSSLLLSFHSRESRLQACQPSIHLFTECPIFLSPFPFEKLSQFSIIVALNLLVDIVPCELKFRNKFVVPVDFFFFLFVDVYNGL